MPGYLPSEVARLVLGYLKEEECSKTYTMFLKECIHLQEYNLMLKRGREYPTKIGGKALKEMLDGFYLFSQLLECGPHHEEIGSRWIKLDDLVCELKVLTTSRPTSSSQRSFMLNAPFSSLCSSVASLPLSSQVCSVSPAQCTITSCVRSPVSVVHHSACSTVAHSSHEKKVPSFEEHYAAHHPAWSNKSVTNAETSVSNITSVPSREQFKMCVSSTTRPGSCTSTPMAVVKGAAEHQASNINNNNNNNDNVILCPPVSTDNSGIPCSVRKPPVLQLHCQRDSVLTVPKTPKHDMSVIRSVDGQGQAELSGMDECSAKNNWVYSESTSVCQGHAEETSVSYEDDQSEERVGTCDLSSNICSLNDLTAQSQSTLRESSRNSFKSDMFSSDVEMKELYVQSGEIKLLSDTGKEHTETSQKRMNVDAHCSLDVIGSEEGDGDVCSEPLDTDTYGGLLLENQPSIEWHNDNTISSPIKFFNASLVTTPGKRKTNPPKKRTTSAEVLPAAASVSPASDANSNSTIDPALEHLAEKIAENINKVVATKSDCWQEEQELKLENKSLDAILSDENTNIQDIIDMTRNDPAFDALFNLFNVDKHQFIEKEYLQQAEGHSQQVVQDTGSNDLNTPPHTPCVPDNPLFDQPVSSNLSGIKKMSVERLFPAQPVTIVGEVKGRDKVVINNRQFHLGQTVPPSMVDHITILSPVTYLDNDGVRSRPLLITGSQTDMTVQDKTIITGAHTPISHSTKMLTTSPAKKILPKMLSPGSADLYSSAVKAVGPISGGSMRGKSRTKSLPDMKINQAKKRKKPRKLVTKTAKSSIAPTSTSIQQVSLHSFTVHNSPVAQQSDDGAQTIGQRLSVGTIRATTSTMATTSTTTTPRTATVASTTLNGGSSSNSTVSVLVAPSVAMTTIPAITPTIRSVSTARRIMSTAALVTSAEKISNSTSSFTETAIESLKTACKVSSKASKPLAESLTGDGATCTVTPVESMKHEHAYKPKHKLPKNTKKTCLLKQTFPKSPPKLPLSTWSPGLKNLLQIASPEKLCPGSAKLATIDASSLKLLQTASQAWNKSTATVCTTSSRSSTGMQQPAKLPNTKHQRKKAQPSSVCSKGTAAHPSLLSLRDVAKKTSASYFGVTEEEGSNWNGNDENDENNENTTGHVRSLTFEGKSAQSKNNFNIFTEIEKLKATNVKRSHKSCTNGGGPERSAQVTMNKTDKKSEHLNKQVTSPVLELKAMSYKTSASSDTDDVNSDGAIRKVVYFENSPYTTEIVLSSGGNCDPRSELPLTPGQKLECSPTKTELDKGNISDELVLVTLGEDGQVEIVDPRVHKGEIVPVTAVGSLTENKITCAQTISENSAVSVEAVSKKESNGLSERTGELDVSSKSCSGLVGDVAEALVSLSSSGDSLMEETNCLAKKRRIENAKVFKMPARKRMRKREEKTLKKTKKKSSKKMAKMDIDKFLFKVYDSGADDKIT